MRIALASAALLAAAATAGAEEPKNPPLVQSLTAATSTAPAVAPAVKPKVIALTISPMPLTKPAMKYSLILQSEDRKTGNAANFYNAAVTDFLQLNGTSNFDAWEEFRDKSIFDITPAEIQKATKDRPFNLYWLERGAERAHAEWPIERSEGIAAQIPALGAKRLIANRLSVEIRRDILEKKFPQAIDKIRISMTYGRHLCEGDTVIEGLVGAGVCELTAGRLRDLIQQPEAPNLYWSLSQLPQPLIRLAIENDNAMILVSFPELLKVRRGTFNDGDWESLMSRIGDPASFLGQALPNAGAPRWAGQVGLMAINVRTYPRARAFLKELGRTEEELDAMGAKKVLATYYYESYRQWVDEATKTLSLPAREALQMKSDWATTMRNSVDFRYNPLLYLISNLEVAAESTTRTERSIAALRIIEALRLYLAEHDNQWPKTLADCSVPIPDDPTTGKPFAYAIENNKAILESPAINARNALRYELTLRP